MDLIFYFKQKTAYEMRISDWSSDVCSSDLHALGLPRERRPDLPRHGQIEGGMARFEARIIGKKGAETIEVDAPDREGAERSLRRRGRILTIRRRLGFDLKPGTLGRASGRDRVGHEQ